MTTACFTWDTIGDNVLCESDGIGSIEQTYNNSPETFGEPISVIAESEMYLHYDGGGCTRQLSDAEGAVQATYDYNAYGALLSGSGAASTPLRFGGAGGYYTTAQGSYVRRRYYSAVDGSWLSCDPLSQVGVSLPMPFGDDPSVGSTTVMAGVGTNLYVYAWNSPLTHLDPSGLQPDEGAKDKPCDEAKETLYGPTSPVLAVSGAFKQRLGHAAVLQIPWDTLNLSECAYVKIGAVAGVKPEFLFGSKIGPFGVNCRHNEVPYGDFAAGLYLNALNAELYTGCNLPEYKCCRGPVKKCSTRATITSQQSFFETVIPGPGTIYIPFPAADRVVGTAIIPSTTCYFVVPVRLPWIGYQQWNGHCSWPQCCPLSEAEKFFLFPPLEEE
jgi:RHS repeat-associated protein